MGVLFDLDGTLLDTLEDLTDSVNFALTACSLPLCTKEQVRQYLGSGAAYLMRRAAGDSWEQAYPLFRAYYQSHCQIKTRPYAGILQALAALGEKHPLAIVSNKPDGAVKALCSQYFPGILAVGEHPGCPRKPNPAMLHEAAAEIGAERYVYVGDSEVDITAANNAGVPCVSVLWGFRDEKVLREAGGRWFCQSPRELPELIEKMGEQYGK